MSTAQVSADALDKALRADTSPERAANEKRYLKSDLTFYGLTVPQIRKVAKTWKQEHPDPGHDELVGVVEALWSEPVHERRFLAVELLNLHNAVLVADDIVLLERLLRESLTWALVDSLAATATSSLLERHPDSDGVVERWAGDEDFWIRRSALLVHLLPLRQGTGDFERFGRIADPMLEEKEFFIRKAIGWVLRDMARRQPEVVYAWIAPRAHRASGVTVREAVKYLPPERAEAVTASYKTGEPLGS